MKIRLRKKRNQYAQVHQNMLRDRLLSLKAKGLGAVLESYSDEFEVSMKAIESKSVDGEKSIASAAKELEAGYYLYRFQTRDEDGRFITYWAFDSQTLDVEYLKEIIAELEDIRMITDNNLLSSPTPRQRGAVTEGPSTAPRSTGSRSAETRQSRTYKKSKEQNSFNQNTDDNNNLSVYEPFQDFRARILNDYTGKPLVAGLPSYQATTVISVTNLGYLHNTHSKKDLSPEDAKAVWDYLYRHPEKIGQLSGIKS